MNTHLPIEEGQTKRVKTTDSGQSIRQNDKYAKVWSLRSEDIKLSDSIRDSFQIWRDNHMSFLSQTSAGDPLDSPSALYCYARATDNSSLHRKILFRFLQMAFHQVLDKLSKLCLHQDAIRILKGIILRSEIPDKHTVEKHLNRWTSNGKKFADMGTKFGGTGYLFLLPESITETL